MAISIKKNRNIPINIGLILIAQLIPITFIGIDLSELGLEWNFQNALDIYKSQRVYLFSSLATPLFFLIIKIQYNKLHKQKNFFENVLNGLPELVSVFDLNYVLNFKNASFLDYELPDKIENLVKENSNKLFFNYSFKSLNRNMHFLGTVTHFENGHILILKDITEVKESELIIQEQEKQLSRSSQLASLGEMASGIAHEINNPLGVIIANIEIIRKLLKDPNGKIEKCLDTINKMVTRMSGIIKAMKKLSRIEGADHEIIDLEDLFTDVMNISQINIKKYEVKTDYNLEEFKNKRVLGSNVQLSQVFINLINNACHAIESYDEKWIRIKIFEDENQFNIIFSNSGPQIPDHIQDKIFEPFFTTKEPGKGTGLGLSLSKTILEAHKGKLRLNKEALSPEFIVEIPKQ